MNIDTCEQCGHPADSHQNGGHCLWCEADKEADHNVMICEQFKPDIFDMWKEDSNESEGSNRAN